MIKKDSNLLRDASIMDYSLLLAVEKNPYKIEHKQTNRINNKSKGVKYKPKNSLISSNIANNSSVRKKNLDLSSSPKVDEKDNLVNPWEQVRNDRHLYISKDLEYIYHISIIDYLQDYNFDKKLEHFLKTAWRGVNSEISAVNPIRYCERFKEFMEGEVLLLSKERKDSLGDLLNVTQTGREKVSAAQLV